MKSYSYDEMVEDIARMRKDTPQTDDINRSYLVGMMDAFAKMQGVCFKKVLEDVKERCGR